MPEFNLDHLKQFRFKQLFNELGWDQPAQQQPYAVAVGDDNFELDIVAHKRGVQVLHCRPDARGHVPAYATRQKIERKVTAEAREHLIVFTDAAQETQIWQWVTRLAAKPAQYREVAFRPGESAELLRQKLSRLRFTLDEEELLTVLGVTKRLEDAIPRDKVTKKFYGEFDTQRKAFAAFIAGIPGTGEDLRWYTAVLIDRLMFLWFLQEKSFLDGKKHYLQERLATHLASHHRTSFYRHFLSPLFFRGFAEERTGANRNAIRGEFGDVPYLNGGLFAQHELEQRYGDALDVADSAFERLFAFFDEWEWHLDDRPTASGREINPDVLGYIFEKFVNQVENPKGAYYTKEDVTEYIGRNSIIPSLLTKVRAEHPSAFDELAWTLLQQSGDAYIYPAMLKGANDPYPTEISNGLDTEAPDLLVRRVPWNKRADEATSLPTEIWRETIARHQRTRDIRCKIAAGELRTVDDLITHNLDIRQFAQDLIERCTDVALLKSFWSTLAGRLPLKSNEKFRHGLSVLDPTCGSGAFLFAALNILKPLYDASLRTLHAVRGDALIAGEKNRPEKWAEIDDILKRFAADKSDRLQDYAIVKHIIVHNLYGVDIEEQATEIAKLRLFLKLIALLEPGDDIEPLPDIDFNIRHGNTLVGYATADETEKAVRGTVGGKLAGQGNLLNDAWDEISIRLVAVEQQYDNFQLQQVQRGGHVSAQDKQALTDTLHDLEETLNYHLAREYGVDPTKSKKYGAWKASHKPFHWYVDFHALMRLGGFDAIIGNPPWKEYAAVKKYYGVIGYETIDSGNLYGICIERAFQISQNNSRVSFIVQLPLASASRMRDMRRYIERNAAGLWIATFDDRPGKLFEGLQHCRSTIFIAQKGAKKALQPAFSRYQRWPTEARSEMIACLRMAQYTWPNTPEGAWPKVDDPSAASALHKLLTGSAQPIERRRKRTESKHFVYYQEAAQYWVKATSRLPYYAKNDEETAPSHGRWLYFDTAGHAAVASAILNSSLFYAWFVTFGDCFHVTDTLVSAFPVPEAAWADRELVALNGQLMKQLKQGALRKVITSRQAGQVDRIEYDEYYASSCKELIDSIDQRLAVHFGFTQPEIDAVCAFDLKFRVGAEAEGVDDD